MVRSSFSLPTNLEEARTIEQRRRVVREKPFLFKIYQEWYAELMKELPAGEGKILEIGAGPGFLDEVCSNVIRSDLLPSRHLDLVFDAGRLPFRSGTLRSVLMTNVLHHLPHTRSFFLEAARCVCPGGHMKKYNCCAENWRFQRLLRGFWFNATSLTKIRRTASACALIGRSCPIDPRKRRSWSSSPATRSLASERHP